MLKIDFSSGIGRRIRVKKSDDSSSYALNIEISANFLTITVKLSLVEAVSFFSKGQNIVNELTKTNLSPIPSKIQRKSGRKSSNLL